MTREIVSEVAIAGATGAVGQQLITNILRSFPHIQLHLAASAKAGILPYGRAISYWTQEEPLSEKIKNIPVYSVEAPIKCQWIFSALPKELAKLHEPRWVAEGKWVISMACAHRLEPEVPTVVRDVNQSHLEPALRKMKAGQGALICKPNCAAAILATFIKPLMGLGLKKVSAVSLQSLSGAGYPGPSAWQMIGDFIGHIEGEACKIEEEMPRLLGSWQEKSCSFALDDQIEWTVTSMRVPVARGHSLQLELEFEKAVSAEEFALVLSHPHLTHVEDYQLLTPKKVMARACAMKVYWGNHRIKKPARHQVLVIGDNLGRGAASGAVEIWRYCQTQLARLT
jgi:aspartate-semialdehyde dehydrogenase